MAKATAKPKQGEAIAAGEGGVALERALIWWRDARAPAIADLIDVISARVSGPPITDAAEWQRVAMQKGDLGRLLPGVTALAAASPGRVSYRLSIGTYARSRSPV